MAIQLGGSDGVFIALSPGVSTVAPPAGTPAVVDEGEPQTVQELLEAEDGQPSLKPAHSMRMWSDKLLQELQGRLRQGHTELERAWRTRPVSTRWRNTRCMVETRSLGKVSRMRRLKRRGPAVLESS